MLSADLPSWDILYVKLHVSYNFKSNESEEDGRVIWIKNKLKLKKSQKHLNSIECIL